MAYDEKDKWQLKLYVFGDDERNRRAIRNLQEICDTCLGGNCEISVLDVMEHPAVAIRDDIIVTPTIIREFPLPMKRIVGDLTNKEKLRKAFGVIDDEAV